MDWGSLFMGIWCGVVFLFGVWWGMRKERKLHEQESTLTTDDIKFIIDKYSELPIQYSLVLFEEILRQFNEQRR